MPDSVAVVNHAFATTLAAASRRTLLTLCHYHQLPQQLLAPPELGRWVAEQLVCDLPMRLTRLLTPPAQTLALQLLEAPLPAPQGRMPWQLPLPRPVWADLTPLEQLLALGVLVSRRADLQITLEFPAVMRDAVRQLATLAAPALPMVPPLLAVRDAAVHILLQLEQRPAAHRGMRCWAASTMAALLARGVARPLLEVLHPLLHSCGLLEHDAAGCHPAVAASRWLLLSPAEQLDSVLSAWQQQPLLRVDRLPELGGVVVDWPALLDVVWTALADAPTPLTLQQLLAHCESVVGPLLAFPRAMASPRRRQPFPDPTALLEAILI